jgi:tetratricopeptide (TPR) repeat protein
LDGLRISEINQRKRVDTTYKWASVSVFAPSTEIIAALKTSLEITRELKDENLEAKICAQLAAICFTQGNNEEGFGYAEQVLARSDALSDELPVAIAWAVTGFASVQTSSFSRAISLHTRAIPILQRAGHLLEGFSRSNLAFALARTGNFPKSLEMFGQALEVIRAGGFRSIEGVAMFWRASARIYMGDWNAAVADCDEARPIVEEAGDPLPIAFNLLIQGHATFMGGDGDRGIALARRGLETLLKTDVTVGLSVALTFLAEPLCLVGQRDEAKTLAQRSIGLDATGDNYGQLKAYQILAMSDAEAAQPDWLSVETNIKTSIRLAEERGANQEVAIAHFRYAECLHKKKGLKAARVRLDEADALFRDMGMNWWAEQAEVSRVRIDSGAGFKWFAPWRNGVRPV